MSTYIKRFDTEAEYDAWLSGYTEGRPAAAFVKYPNGGNGHFVPFYLVISGTLDESGFTYETGATILRIECNSDWNVSASTDWITLESVSGNGSSNLEVEIDSNMFSSTTRNGNIVLSHNGQSGITFIIQQQGNPDARPNDEIWYVTDNSSVAELRDSGGTDWQGGCFSGACLVSNTYDAVAGHGVLKFDRDITYVDISWPFGYSNRGITSVKFPFSIKTIKGRFFYSQASVQEVVIPYGCEVIGYGGGEMFNKNCPITSFTIPSTCKKLGSVFKSWGDFNGFSALTIPEGVEFIGSTVFAMDRGSNNTLKEISFPSTIQSMDDSVVDAGPSLSAFTGSYTGISDNRRFLLTGSTMVGFAGNGYDNVIIPDNVVNIKTYINNYPNITAMTINNNVNFNNSYWSFIKYCDNIQVINGNHTGITSDRKGLYRIQSNKNHLGYYSPVGVTNLTIDSNIDSIDMEDFFSDNSAITSLDTNNSENAGGSSSFMSCNSLTSVTLGDKTTEIKSYNFRYSYNIVSFTCKATTPPSLGYAALADTNNCPIYVPSASVETYKAATGWSSYADRIQAIPE